MTNIVKKNVKEGYTVLGKATDNATVKAFKKDTGGEFYVYDLYEKGKVIALNRYVFKTNDLERPFTLLSKTEEEILNPPIVIEEPDTET